MNSNPTVKQKEWQRWCVEIGCLMAGGEGGPVAFHHIGGSKMKIKGLNKEKPGEWYGIPLSYWWHQNESNPAARHVNKKRFEREAGRTEKEMFIKLVKIYEDIYRRKPMSEWVYNLIVERA